MKKPDLQLLLFIATTVSIIIGFIYGGYLLYCQLKDYSIPPALLPPSKKTEFKQVPDGMDRVDTSKVELYGSYDNKHWVLIKYLKVERKNNKIVIRN